MQAWVAEIELKELPQRHGLVGCMSLLRYFSYFVTWKQDITHF